MRNRLNLNLILAVALAASVNSANALVVSATPGTLHNATSVTDFILSPAMAGMPVTATFVGGGSDTRLWAPIPVPPAVSANTAGVSGSAVPGWSLQGAGNTFAMIWQFCQTAEFAQGCAGGPSGTSNASILSLTLSGFSTNIAFDRSAPSFGTAGSLQGLDFRVDTNGDGLTDDPAGWTATYSDAIGLNGAAPLNDLYSTLTITFGANGYNGNFSFLQDTDSFVPGTGGGGNGGGNVPEPATLFLFGMGLAGLAFAKARMKT